MFYLYYIYFRLTCTTAAYTHIAYAALAFETQPYLFLVVAIPVISIIVVLSHKSLHILYIV